MWVAIESCLIVQSDLEIMAVLASFELLILLPLPIRADNIDAGGAPGLKLYSVHYLISGFNLE